MSHDLANAMRTAIMLEMKRQDVSPRQMEQRAGSALPLFDDTDMLMSTAAAMARALGCRWEARLHQRETAAEAVALVRDVP